MEKLIRWLIKVFLPGHHVAKNLLIDPPWDTGEGVKEGRDALLKARESAVVSALRWWEKNNPIVVASRSSSRFAARAKRSAGYLPHQGGQEKARRLRQLAGVFIKQATGVKNGLTTIALQSTKAADTGDGI